MVERSLNDSESVCLAANVTQITSRLSCSWIPPRPWQEIILFASEKAKNKKNKTTLPNHHIHYGTHGPFYPPIIGNSGALFVVEKAVS